MFHDTKGCNVVLTGSKSEAAWKPNQTGGLAFSDRPLTHLEKVTITFNGSGAAELGLTTVDPATLESEVPNDVGNLKGYLFLNDIKLHKRTCKMEIVLDEQAKVVYFIFCPFITFLLEVKLRCVPIQRNTCWKFLLDLHLRDGVPWTVRCL